MIVKTVAPGLSSYSPIDLRETNRPFIPTLIQPLLSQLRAKDAEVMTTVQKTANPTRFGL